MDIESQAKEGTEKALTPFRQFITEALAKINGDTALKASVTELSEKLTKSEAAVAKLTSDLATSTAAHQAEVAKLTAEHATALEQARQTAGAAALAKIGVVAVPAASTDSTQGAETIETIRAQINAEKDPAKRYILAQKARELRGHADLFKRN